MSGTKNVEKVSRNGTETAGIGVRAAENPCNHRRNPAGPFLAISGSVIWFYERKGEHMRCEIRQLIEGDRFSLVVTLPDGTERMEVFDDSSALNRRSIELEKTLVQKGWNGPFARGI